MAQHPKYNPNILDVNHGRLQPKLTPSHSTHYTSPTTSHSTLYTSPASSSSHYDPFVNSPTHTPHTTSHSTHYTPPVSSHSTHYTPPVSSHSTYYTPPVSSHSTHYTLPVSSHSTHYTPPASSSSHYDPPVSSHSSHYDPPVSSHSTHYTPPASSSSHYDPPVNSPTHTPHTTSPHNPFQAGRYGWGNPTDTTSQYIPERKKVRHNMAFKRIRENLPIYPYKDQIIQRIKQSQVIVIEGETGSGKSTQIPQWCLEVSEMSRVVCTEPRRIAAISLATRVAQEMGVTLGADDVGYIVRFDNKSSKNTSLKYVTDGILVRQIMTDRYLDNYDVIVIDEVHERRTVTDVLIGLIKQVLPYRPELKVVVMSATLNTNKFIQFFKDNQHIKCDLLKIPGKIYPIKKIFWPAVTERTQFSSDEAKRFDNYVIFAVNVVMEICTSERKEGDILVFVTGRDEIDFICDRLEELISIYSRSFGQIDIIPLYGEMPYSSQQKIFSPAPPSIGDKLSRKCIIATNIAETSITIEGIVFVIDSGKVKLSSLDKKFHMKSLLPVSISKSSAEQRAGRAGRTQPGICYRLYKEEDYKSMAADTIPEILRCDLTTEILRLRVIGIDLSTFDTIDQPDIESQQIALERLRLLNALDNQNEVTPIGWQMSKFPMDAEVARMLVASQKYSCQTEILTLASMLSGDRPGSVFVLVGKKRREMAQQMRKKFTNKSGDHLTYINVYNQFKENNFSEDWCFDNYVNFKILNDASNIFEQLESIMLGLKLMDPVYYHIPCEDSNVLKAILTGNICHLARKTVLKKSFNQEYKTVRGNTTVTLHPSTCLDVTSSDYQLLTYSTCLKTNARRCYISTVSVIEEEWYKEVAAITGAPPLPTNDWFVNVDMMRNLSLNDSNLFNNFL